MRILGHTSVSSTFAKSLIGLYFERLLRIASILFTTALLARYLGSEQFGELAFILSIVAIANTLASLGLSDILIKRLSNEAKSLTPLIASLSLRMISGVIFSLVACLAIWFFLEQKVPGLIFCVGIILIAPLYSFEQLLFANSEGQAIAKLGLLEIVVTLLFRILIVSLDLGIYWLLASYFTESFFRLLLLTAFAWKRGYIQRDTSTITMDYTLSLFRSGLPLMLAGLAVVLYMKIDQLMIREMLGPAELGLYSIAVRMTEAFYFLPLILTTAALPILSHASEQEAHHSLFIELYQKLFYGGALISLTLLLLGESLIVVAFGDEYAEAAEYLKVYALSLPLIFVGVASGKWLIIENLERHALQRTVFGLLVNFLLNFLLIPLYGCIGAATATVLSQLCATVIYDFVFIETRTMGKQKINALYSRP